MEQAAQRQNHFSIRKLTIGTASVLLGTSLYFGTQTSQVHAEVKSGNGVQSTTVGDSEAPASSAAKPLQVASSAAVKTLQVANSATTKSSAASSSAATSSSDATVSAASSAVSNAASQANSAALSSAATSSAANNDIETTTLKIETNKDVKKVDAKKLVNALDEDKTSINKATEKQSYQVNISFWNDVTNAPLTYTGKLPATNGSFNQEVKAGDLVGILGMAPTGYKLLNPEAITSNFEMKGNLAYVDGHDVDITLHYAPLSPIYVEYVNEENGKVLSTTGVGSNTSSSQSIANAAGDVMYPGESKFLVHAIDIPGYELVSDPEYIGYYDQVQSANNSNPIIVQFKYKKITQNDDPKEIKAGANVDGQWFGPVWEKLPGGFNATGVYGVTYEEENGDIEAKYQAMIDRYQKQGYSYVGTFNYHKNSDYFNFNEAGISVDLIPNKPVKVHYVDENNKELQPSIEVAQNPNNPDQTNNGINDAAHWHPEGHWAVEAKDIPDYVLTKTYGATSGSYVPYEYNVTFVYTKKETKVPTTPPVDNKEVAGAVLYIDDTTKTTLDTVKLEGKVGQKIDYNTDPTIKNYEKQGYKLVSSDYKNGDETFTNGSNVFEVHFKHGTTPINPNHPGIPGEPITTPEGPKFPDGTSKEDLEKTVTRTITYVASSQKDGYPFTAPKTVTQNIKFTAEGTIDNVTGNLVTVDKDGNIINQKGELTWTPEDSTLDAVNSPVVNYYHVVSVSADSKDNVNVDATTVNHDSNNINVVVTYAPNGHIIPVDPNGNPIPDVPTTDLPPYPTDPTNPSRVVPNVPIPEVPGYVPENPNKDHNVPTPPNPGDDVKVPYIKKETATVPPLVDTKPEAVIGSVTYIDDTTGKTLSTATIAGGIGEKITYTTTSTVDKYENEGYDFVSSDFENGNEVFEKTGNKFEVHFTEGIIPVNPQNPGKPGEPLNPDDPEGKGPKYPQGTDEKSLNKTVTRTIKFVDENGNEVAKSIEQSVHFTASGVLNKVTGEWITPLTWSPKEEAILSEKVPVVEHYHVVNISKDGNGLTSVNGVTLKASDSDYDVVVTYKENGHIIPTDPEGHVIPNAPQPQYPTDPKNPSGVTPNEPVPEVPGYTPEKSTVTPPNPGEDTPVVYVPVTPSTPTPTDPTPAPQPQPNPDTNVPDEPTPEVPNEGAPMPHPQTPEVPEEPADETSNTPAPHATTPETPVSEENGEVPVVHAANDNEEAPMPHATQEALPQTGEKTSVSGIIAGALASALGIIGLASRRKEDK